MPIDIGEKRTRLPIMLLVVSGYFLGVMLPLPVQGISWLRRNSEFWALVLFLAFLFLFSKGRERLIGLLRELESQSELEMTRADERYERVVHYVSLGYALCICVIWGFGAGYFARENLGLNIYISIAIGVFLCWGSVAFVLRG